MRARFCQAISMPKTFLVNFSIKQVELRPLSFDCILPLYVFRKVYTKTSIIYYLWILETKFNSQMIFSRFMTQMLKKIIICDNATGNERLLNTKTNAE